MTSIKIDPRTSVACSVCPANDSIIGCRMDVEFAVPDGTDRGMIGNCAFHDAFSKLIGMLDRRLVKVG